MSREEILIWLFIVQSVHMKILHSVQASFSSIHMSPGNMFLSENMPLLVNLICSTIKEEMILLLKRPHVFRPICTETR